MDPRREPPRRPEPPRPHHTTTTTTANTTTQHDPRPLHQQDQPHHHQALPTQPPHARHATAAADHDSVISPFSPKPSSAPSPSASIASDKRLSLPPRAHLDPEKAYYAHDSDPTRVSPNAVHDKSEYHEKDPEDKAWQLLVRLPCNISLAPIAN